MAGTVEQVGPAVTEFAPGEEVLGYVRKDHVQWGTYAELVAAPVRTLAHRPPGLDIVTAGALPLVGLTALQALRAASTGPGSKGSPCAAGGMPACITRVESPLRRSSMVSALFAFRRF